MKWVGSLLKIQKLNLLFQSVEIELRYTRSLKLNLSGSMIHKFDEGTDQEYLMTNL